MFAFTYVVCIVEHRREDGMMHTYVHTYIHSFDKNYLCIPIALLAVHLSSLLLLSLLRTCICSTVV